jgi:hypothetical protein
VLVEELDMDGPLPCLRPAPAGVLLDAQDNGDDPEEPRHDLKRPWDAVTNRAGLSGIRIHDLRPTYTSFGAGGGLGLPIAWAAR